MNCLDCAAINQIAPAVAICADCGATVCQDHTHIAPHWLTRTALINHIEVVDPPGRTVRCAVCQTAHDAADRRAAS